VAVRITEYTSIHITLHFVRLVVRRATGGDGFCRYHLADLQLFFQQLIQLLILFFDFISSRRSSSRLNWWSHNCLYRSIHCDTSFS